MTCEKCGETLHVGSFPFCPHGDGFMRVNGDECDYVDHNLGREPIRITSWSQRRAIMAARGLTDYQHDVEVPEGMAPNAQRPSRWGAYRRVDPEHMAWLASKLSTGKAEKTPEEPPMQITTWQSYGDPSERYR
jgi:hypothetical protein